VCTIFLAKSSSSRGRFNKHPRLWHSRPVEEPSTASKTDIPDHSTDARFTPQSGHRLSWKSLFAWDCVVADAVAVEPVSQVGFPANREINREFCQFCPYSQPPLLDSRNDSAGLERNSLLVRTGNIFCGTGNLPQANRESLNALERRACAPPAAHAARALGQNIP
jgi:hypothetical protein